MELKEFISDTITQISEGIVDAQKNTKKHKTLINPPYKDVSKPLLVTENILSKQPVSFIDFDIAVTVENSDNSKTGGKIGISSCFVGKEKEGETLNQHSSRIKFSIPILFPQGEIKK